MGRSAGTGAEGGHIRNIFVSYCVFYQKEREREVSLLRNFLSRLSLSLSQDCSKGLSVYPQAGKVIIFYSMLPDGSMDDFSLHGGCDVLLEHETKWSANFWLWNKPNHFGHSAARKRFTKELKDQSL